MHYFKVKTVPLVDDQIIEEIFRHSKPYPIKIKYTRST